MTVTLTTQELYQFQQKLHFWYHERSVALFKRAMELRQDPCDPMSRPSYIKFDLDKAMTEWEADHPKPDWQSLLAEVAAS